MTEQTARTCPWFACDRLIAVPRQRWHLRFHYLWFYGLPLVFLGSILLAFEVAFHD